MKIQSRLALQASWFSPRDPTAEAVADSGKRFEKSSLNLVLLTERKIFVTSFYSCSSDFIKLFEKEFLAMQSP